MEVCKKVAGFWMEVEGLVIIVEEGVEVVRLMGLGVGPKWSGGPCRFGSGPEGAGLLSFRRLVGELSLLK